MSVLVEHFANAAEALPFSSAVRIGELILLSGEIGVEDDGSLGVGLETQTRRALANIERTLHRSGLDRAAIVKCTIMLSDMREWGKFNEVYVPFFSGMPLPARSAFESSRLAFGALVEIECIAVRH